MARIPISVELYSVRESLANDLEGTLKKMKEIGYDAVEFAGGIMFPAERVKKALDDAGLWCSGWHISLEVLNEENFDKTVEYHKAVGNKNLIIPWIPNEMYASYAQIKKTAEMFNGLVKKLKAHGLYTGYHNHNEEFKPLPDAENKTAWTAIRELTDSTFIMQMDTGNALSGNADVNKEILSAAGRCQIIHFKPYSIEKAYATIIGAETDDIDYKTILPFMLGEGKTQVIVIEYECKELYSEIEGVDLCYKGLINNFDNLLQIK